MEGKQPDSPKDAPAGLVPPNYTEICDKMMADLDRDYGRTLAATHVLIPPAPTLVSEAKVAVEAPVPQPEAPVPEVKAEPKVEAEASAKAKGEEKEEEKEKEKEGEPGKEPEDAGTEGYAPLQDDDGEVNLALSSPNSLENLWRRPRQSRPLRRNLRSRRSRRKSRVSSP